jgi:hypothetical protein
MGETNSPSVAHVGYDIYSLLRAKFKTLTTHLTACGCNFKFNSLDQREQLKENLFLPLFNTNFISKSNSITDLTTCGERYETF